jgi:YD repeat-containing protein
MKCGLILLAACGGAPAPAVANKTTEVTRDKAPIAACPFGVPSAFDHEVVAGCAPAPFEQTFNVCRHHDCPQPCKITVGNEIVVVTYDHGRFVSTKHLDDAKHDHLRDQSCTYDAAGRLAACTDSFFGVMTAKRDASGQLVEIAMGDQAPRTFTFDAQHRLATYAEYHTAFEPHYEAGRVAQITWHYKGKDSATTYGYNADGDVVSESDTEDKGATAYSYDADHRLVGVATRDGESFKLVYDNQDRLIEMTSTDPNLAPQSTFVTKYGYCE